MLQVFFFVLIATGTAIGQSQVECHGLLNWAIVKPKAHLGSRPFNSKTVALNAVDGVVPNTVKGHFEECAITKGKSAKKSLTIDLHRTYLISSIKTHLRQKWRAIWQNGLKVYVGPNNNTHEGNTQCGLAYIHQRDNPNYEPVFNCTPPVRGRFVFLLRSDNHGQGLQVCEVEVKAVTFDRLPSLPNACSHNASLDTTVTYHCEEGYVSDGGKATSTCLKNGTWSQPSLNCRKQCPPPPTEYEDKELLPTKNVGNLRSTYACPHGKGPRQQTMHCSKDGQWIKDLESCKVLLCPDVPAPLPPLTLSIEENDDVIGSKRKYSCNDSCYELIGTASQTCVYSSDGRHAVWSSEVPTCQTVACNQCAPPIQNAVVQYVNYTPWNAEATYHCEEGYVSDGGKATSTCLESGTWSYPSLYCRKPCPLPPFKYKELLLRENFRNMAALYACPYGTVQRYQMMQCGDDGKWIENFEPCEAVDCGKPDDPLYGYHRKLSSNYKFEAEIEYACYYGYKLQGEKKASCQSTGNWGPQSPPTCKVMTCPDLVPLKFGSVEINDNHVNATAKFKCNSGYDLAGPQTITCRVINEVVSWSHVSPTCQPKRCSRPRVPGNGTVVGEDFHYPNTIRFVCNKGYILTPAKSFLRCGENGKWKYNDRIEMNFPTCEPVDCGKPDDHLYGYHRKLSNNYKFKAEVEYACYYGYALQGKEKAVCLSTGNWDLQSLPTCKVMRCFGLAPPEFGTVQLEGRNVNDTAKFKCNSGYDLVGHKAVTCKAINKVALWSHLFATCQPKRCSRPRVPGNGTVVGEDFRYPNTIEFRCNQGYVLTPTKSVWRCSENGNWKDNERRETNFPTCEPISCGEPPAMRTGRIRGNNFVFGSRVEYYCDSGFKRVGSSTLECLHTRKWYPTPPKCLELLCPYLRAPENGKSLFTGLIVGSVVHYSCKSGYTIAINDEKVDNIEQVSLRCIQIGNQDTARSMWKGALTSMPPTCKP